MTNETTEPIDHWQNDRLSRKSEAELVLNYIIRRLDSRVERGEPRSFVLNIDAPWGSGKTFFLQSLQKEMESKGCLVAYVNAWEHDHGEDAILPILSSIKTVLEHHAPSSTRSYAETAIRTGGKIAMHVAKGAATQFAKKYIGEEFANISGEAVTALTDAATKSIDMLADAAVDEIEERVKLVKSFHEQLSKVISDLGQADPNQRQLFVFVDELDRCRPTYAIELLERVKHIFNLDGTAFVVATDTVQLTSSISKVYGQSFNGENYLRRFFDRRYELKKSTQIELIKGQVTPWESNQKLSWPKEAGNLAWFITKLAQGFKLTARDSIQCIGLLDDIVVNWQEKPDIELSYLAPLAMLYQTQRPLFEALAIRARNETDVKKLVDTLNWDLTPANVRRDGGTIPSRRFFQMFENFYQKSGNLRHELFNIDRQHLNETENWVLDRIMKEFGNSMSDQDRNDKTILDSYFERIRSLSNFK